MKSAAAAALLLAACGGAGEPAAGAERYRALCAARALPERPDASARRHLRAVGEAVFGDGAAAVAQAAELWQAGGERMRYRLRAPNGNDVVFLFDESAGRLRRSGGEWEDYEGAELRREMCLRWELLRFPWGWEAEIAAAPAASAWVRRAGEGEMVIEIGGDDRALRGSYAGVEAGLSEWAPAADAPWLAARVWAWNGPSGRRVERFATVDLRFSFFDEAFRPPAAGGAPDRAWRALGDGGAAESLGVVRATLWIVDDDGGAQWWLHDGVRVAAVLLAPEAAPPAPDGGRAARADATEHWLRRTLLGDAALAEAAAAELPALARAAGWEPAGGVWRSEGDASAALHTLLLPVRAAGR